MNKRSFLICLIVILPFFVNAQTINVLLPEEANKEYAFVLSKGIRQDTIQKGTLSFSGSVTIHIPDKDKGYTGMGSLQIKDNAPFNFIISGAGFDVEQGADSKCVFKNSPENAYLYSVLQDRVTPSANSARYAPVFIDMVRYMQQLDRAVQTGNLKEKSVARMYALQKLDIDKLYTSGIWYNVIDGLVRLNTDQQTLGQNMTKILERIKSQEVYEHLVDNLITITQQFGLDDAFDIIIPYVQQSGRIETPRENIFMAFAMAKVRRGMTAPRIEGLNPTIDASNAEKTLLVFYQPDCENCHIQLEQLIKIYPKLNQMGVRVVSLSSDHQKESFEKDRKRFPWAENDKLCDFQGFGGKNFINYGIMGTPTFFLIDKNGIIIRRYALIADIDFFGEKTNEK
ncbi:peroxiredoxin [Dysgonomonas sp. PFB1-18]|uniref:peroxiredoxin family protein n=1 Tax=unclassified Dysgonomonas TaxID=2630389 RepID=UPI0024731617|nr:MULTISPECIES: thioredoxin family protein [unclassified Dysgonomonas]MDH6308318.1 peroxiredoxin [Dysgonomonas sp. PF1-14]MDH6338244.1 peroxiredoxin [Dysgonomonas sp. PF1-16]MDH6379741.1 peroxiredoxin [Dysgonomonas sp. PFB1-18]MDH6397169.1 peroxiredoxin [Dysgonomonas sp. PF1-23]